jgi:hypothetical protein
MLTLNLQKKLKSMKKSSFFPVFAAIFFSENSYPMGYSTKTMLLNITKAKKIIQKAFFVEHDPNSTLRKKFRSFLKFYF